MRRKIALLLVATGLCLNSICQVNWEHISTTTDGGAPRLDIWLQNGTGNK